MNTNALKASLLAIAVAIVPAQAFDLRPGQFDRSFTVSVGMQEAMRALGWQGSALPATGVFGWRYEMTTSFTAGRDYFHVSVQVGERAGGHWSGDMCVPRPERVLASA